jgi:hypothetical protein
MYRDYYIAPGTFANWRVAFTNGNIWGLPEGRERTWISLKRGDVVFFYVESPFSSVIGYGEIQGTFREHSPFFADDWREVTNWPLRLSFQIIFPLGDLLVPPGVSVIDMLQFPRLKRFEEVTSRQGEELLRRCQVNLGR